MDLLWLFLESLKKALNLLYCRWQEKRKKPTNSKKGTAPTVPFFYCLGWSAIFCFRLRPAICRYSTKQYLLRRNSEKRKNSPTYSPPFQRSVSRLDNDIKRGQNLWWKRVQCNICLSRCGINGKKLSAGPLGEPSENDWVFWCNTQKLIVATFWKVAKLFML